MATLGSDASQIGADNWLTWWENWRLRWHGDKRKGADTLFALVVGRFGKNAMRVASGALRPQLVSFCPP